MGYNITRHKIVATPNTLETRCVLGI
jgi:hypothetical protein